MKGFTNKLANLALNTKIIIFIALVIMLPFILVMELLLNYLLQTSVNVEKKALDQTTILVKQELLNSVSAKAQIYDLTYKGMIIDLESLKEEILEQGFDDNDLTTYYYKHQIISAVYFINSTNAIFTMPTSDKLSQGTVIDISQIKEFDFVKSGSENNYTGKWLGPYTDFKSQKKIITYALSVWKDNKLVGITGLDISVNTLFTDIVNIDPSQSSYVFIVKTTGDLISSSDKIYDDFKLDKKALTPNILNSQLVKDKKISSNFISTDEKDGVFSIPGNTKEGEKIIAFSSIPSFGGKLVIVSPLSEIIQVQKEKAIEIQQAVSKIGTNGFLYLIVLALIIVFSSFYLSRRYIVKPIIKLKKGIEDLEKTNFGSNIEVGSRDEIGTLAVSFNEMAGRLRESYGTLEQKVKDRTAELEKAKVNLEHSLANIISLQEAIKEERDRAKAIVTSMGEGLIVLDKNMKIVLINPAAEKLLEVNSQYAMGRSIKDITKVFKNGQELADADRPSAKTLVGASMNITIEDNYSVKLISGKEFPVALATTPLRGNGITGVIEVFRDISLEKQSRVLIEQQVVARTKELQTKNIALTSAKEEISRGWLQIQMEKARLLASVNSITLGFLMIDVNGKTMIKNPAVEKTIGIKADYADIDSINQLLGPTFNLKEKFNKCIQERATVNADNIGFNNKLFRLFVGPIFSTDNTLTIIGVVVLIEDKTQPNTSAPIAKI